MLVHWVIGKLYGTLCCNPTLDMEWWTWGEDGDEREPGSDADIIASHLRVWRAGQPGRLQDEPNIPL